MRSTAKGRSRQDALRAAVLRPGTATVALALSAGGAVAWVVAEGVEAVPWDGTRLVYAWTIVPEEMLEMLGSLLWIVALLVTLRAAEHPAAR